VFDSSYSLHAEGGGLEQSVYYVILLTFRGLESSHCGREPEGKYKYPLGVFCLRLRRLLTRDGKVCRKANASRPIRRGENNKTGILYSGALSEL